MTTDKKKKHPTKKKTKSKKTKSKDKKKHNGAWEFIKEHLSKICFFIAVCDLLHALYFTVCAMMLLVSCISALALLAVVSVIFWVVIVIVLLVGLWKRKPFMIKCWLIFSIIGFVLDVLFVLFGVYSALSVDWDRMQQFTIVFVGIFIESLGIYLVYLYYKTMREKPKNFCCNWGDKNKSKSKKSKSGKSQKSSKKKKTKH